MNIWYQKQALGITECQHADAANEMLALLRYSSDSSYLRISMACVRPVGLTRHLKHEDFVLERDDVLVLYKKRLGGISASISFILCRHHNKEGMDTPYFFVSYNSCTTTTYKAHTHIPTSQQNTHCNNTRPEKIPEK
jgi:hypothetical protein